MRPLCRPRTKGHRTLGLDGRIAMIIGQLGSTQHTSLSLRDSSTQVHVPSIVGDARRSFRGNKYFAEGNARCSYACYGFIFHPSHQVAHWALNRLQVAASAGVDAVYALHWWSIAGFGLGDKGVEVQRSRISYHQWSHYKKSNPRPGLSASHFKFIADLRQATARLAMAMG